ncbi:Mkk2p [Rhizophagus irregularis DAOM 197198w]|uniref:Mkk2p n=1 Tax=Rhizophagus irregularis (strain DAOM 197198w) TaxID=1432141 RepID=A0A015LQY0_RHIIW|nr:Mkk2p [Rhizophagus irregularis DAOM 197198w]
MYGNYCLKCNKGYTDIIGKWCRKCQINNFRKDFANWTSGNDKIDNFIQEKQLEINSSQSIIFEWILYDQFSEINEIDNNDFSIVYSAKRKNSPLHWDENCRKYKRHQDNKNNEVTMKYLHNLQNFQNIEEFLNEVKMHSNNFDVYGISQDSDTKDYILVLIDFNHGNYCIKCNKGYTDVKSKWCRQCQINNLKKDFINWTSGDKRIDNFIREKQLEIDSPQSTILKWVPYDQFSEINEVDNNDSFTVYSAIWKNGPLDWDKHSKKYKRHQDNKNNEVALKYLHNLQNIEEFLNEVIHSTSTKFNIYGISPMPNIDDYIIVLQDKGYCIKCNEAYTNITCKWCKQCQTNNLRKNFINWTSENEKIDNFIKEKQLEINGPQSTILEWILYDQFSDINEVNNDDLSIVYSAKWKNGPLHWDENCRKYKRHQDNKNNEVTLKYLHNLQNIEEFLNEVKVHSTNFKVYGISQFPNTEDYILVLIDFNNGNYCIKCNKGYTDVKSKWCRQCQINNFKKDFVNWTSGDEKIDNFIQEKQLKINDSKSIISEWIPYDQFYDINEVDNNDDFTVYSAMQKNRLYWDRHSKKYKKCHNSVTLKYLHNLQNIEEFLNKVKAHSINLKIHGISQNSDTNDYIMILNQLDYPTKCCSKCNNIYLHKNSKWCKSCQMEDIKKTFINWTSGNEIIDNFIQEKQSEINNPSDTIFEWILNNQFFNINKVNNKDDFSTIYSAKWKNGPFHWDKNSRIYKRHQDINVILKCLQNTDELLNEARKYSINEEQSNKHNTTNVTIKIYGISQNLDSKDYILIYNDKYLEKYCENCNKMYIYYKWCKLCQLEYLKTSSNGNEKIDNFIQEMQLKISNPFDIIFEWISYDQFNDIKEIDKGGFATVYSAMWKYGPLYYNNNEKKYIRNNDKKVALKCLYNSQNITNEFLNEIKEYSIDKHGSNILKIYGLSQNPITKEYIIVLEYAEGGNFNKWMNNNFKNFSWPYKIITLLNISNGLKEIHQKRIFHRDLHTGNILFFTNSISKINIFGDNIFISDMGLCGEVDNTDKTKIYGVMPYVAPEVLRGIPYSQSADIYSFGMIMYFAATGRQPFTNCAHDKLLALDICNEIRPEINEQEAPKCYIDLMKKCWDSDPKNRPNSTIIYKSFLQFHKAYKGNILITVINDEEIEIKKQFEEVESYRIVNQLSNENDQSTIHPQAIYISRLLNSFTKELPKYNDNNSECLSCEIK